MKQSKTKRQVNSLVRAVERRQEHPRQVRTHYASLYQVGLDGSEHERQFYGGCLVVGCWQRTAYTDDLEAVEHWIRAHNDLPPMELSEKATPEVDWHGGRALRPWELGLDIDARLRILFGPGAV
jgi:hypothetical protein